MASIPSTPVARCSFPLKSELVQTRASIETSFQHAAAVSSVRVDLKEAAKAFDMLRSYGAVQRTGDPSAGALYVVDRDRLDHKPTQKIEAEQLEENLADLRDENRALARLTRAAIDAGGLPPGQARMIFYHMGEIPSTERSWVVGRLAQLKKDGRATPADRWDLVKGQLAHRQQQAATNLSTQPMRFTLAGASEERLPLPPSLGGRVVRQADLMVRLLVGRAPVPLDEPTVHIDLTAVTMVADRPQGPGASHTVQMSADAVRELSARHQPLFCPITPAIRGQPTADALRISVTPAAPYPWLNLEIRLRVQRRGATQSVRGRKVGRPRQAVDLPIA